MFWGTNQPLPYFLTSALFLTSLKLSRYLLLLFQHCECLMDILRPGLLRHEPTPGRPFIILAPHVNTIGSVSVRIPTWHTLQPGFISRAVPWQPFHCLLTAAVGYGGFLGSIGPSGDFWVLSHSGDFWMLKAPTYLHQWRDAHCSALLVPGAAFMAINSQYCLEIREKMKREQLTPFNSPNPKLWSQKEKSVFFVLCFTRACCSAERCRRAALG